MWRGAGLQVSEKALVLSGGRYYVFVEESPGRFAWNEVEVEGVRDGVAAVVSGVDLARNGRGGDFSSASPVSAARRRRARLKRRIQTRP